MKERPLPANLEAEKLILGSLLCGHLSQQQARDVIGAEDFSVDVHRRIFTAIRGLADRGEAVNRAAVYHQLEEAKQAENCGGLGYLADLEGDSVPVNLAGYLRSVKEAAVRRRGIQACRAAAEGLWAGTDPAPEILARGESRLAELSRELAEPHPAPEFTAIGDRYRLALPGLGVTFDASSTPLSSNPPVFRELGF